MWPILRDEDTLEPLEPRGRQVAPLHLAPVAGSGQGPNRSLAANGWPARPLPSGRTRPSGTGRAHADFPDDLVAVPPGVIGVVVVAVPHEVVDLGTGGILPGPPLHEDVLRRSAWRHHARTHLTT